MSPSLLLYHVRTRKIDHFWYSLSHEGQEGNCGWLKDKFGISWQVVPEILSSLMSDPEKTPSVMKAFMAMKKFDIEALKRA